MGQGDKRLMFIFCSGVLGHVCVNECMTWACKCKVNGCFCCVCVRMEAILVASGKPCLISGGENVLKSFSNCSGAPLSNNVKRQEWDEVMQ